MKVARHRIQLSSKQVEYLRRSSFLPAPLAEMVEAMTLEGDGAGVTHVSRQVAEEFRSAFTNQLAKVGFDLAYEPTSEGRILEELIDSFLLDAATDE